MGQDEYMWLEDALNKIKIDKPVIVLGKGPGLGKVPKEISRTHFVISINQALAAVEHANIVFALDIHHILHVMFDPDFLNKWDYFFIPDEIVLRWFDGINSSRLPFTEESFEDIKLISAEFDGFKRLPFEEVDKIVNFNRFQDKIIRFRRKDIYEKETDTNN